MDISPITWLSASQKGLLHSTGVAYHSHRLYGVPPRFAIYASNTSLDFGRLTGEIGLEFLEGLKRWMDCFLFTFLDTDNGLKESSNPMALTDATLTFFEVALKYVEVSVLGSTEDTELRLLLKEGLTLRSDTMAGSDCVGRSVLDVPSFVGQVLHHIQGLDESYEVARIELPLHFTTLEKAENSKEKQNAQRTFLRDNDALTLRCQDLYDSLDAPKRKPSNPSRYALKPHYRS